MSKKKAVVLKEQEKMIAGVPEWVANSEDLGTAMMQAGQEMMLGVDDVLVRYFKFNEPQIKEFHDKLKLLLNQTEEYERNGLNILGVHDMSIVGDIAQIRFMKERTARLGLETPLLPGAQSFLKALKEVNGGK